jgi:hypothetical protein
MLFASATVFTSDSVTVSVCQVTLLLLQDCAVACVVPPCVSTRVAPL